MVIWRVGRTAVRMKQHYLYGKHVEIAKGNFIGCLYAEHKQKILRHTNAYSSSDSLRNQSVLNS